MIGAMRRFNYTILQVIPTLNAGGAERTTLEIASAVVSAGRAGACGEPWRAFRQRYRDGGWRDISNAGAFEKPYYDLAERRSARDPDKRAKCRPYPCSFESAGLECARRGEEGRRGFCDDLSRGLWGEGASQAILQFFHAAG